MDWKELCGEMGLAGTTAVIVVNGTHPIDTFKTRLQIDPLFSLKTMLRSEGPLAVYKGISAAWLREATYTSMKLGLYGPIKKLYGANNSDASFFLKFAAGSTAGVIGSFFGNPFDVMKTLMMTNKGEKQSLVKVSGAIMKDLGVSGFWRGLEANAVRACVLNGTKMGCYDQIKGYVVNASGWSRSDIKTQFASATGAGFCMACTVTPFDGLRTRLMNQPTDKKLYSGILDCFKQTVQKEGPMSLYRGFLPIWARFAPQATGQLVIFELLRKLAGFEAL